MLVGFIIALVYDISLLHRGTIQFMVSQSSTLLVATKFGASIKRYLMLIGPTWKGRQTVSKSYVKSDMIVSLSR